MTTDESKLRSGLLFRRIVDEGLLLDLQQDVGYRLNEVGMRVIALLSEGVESDSLTARLCGEFEIDEESCAREVADFLDELRSKDLLRSS